MASQGEWVCTFIYNGKFLSASPSWYSLLGCTEEALASMKLEEIFADKAASATLLKRLKDASHSSEGSGEMIVPARIRSCGGYEVFGRLAFEWNAGKNKVFYCSFIYDKDEPVIEDNMIYEYLSEISMSGVMKYDEYSNIVYADRVFETYFGLSDAEGKKTYSFSDNKNFAAFLKAVSENEDCACVEVNGDKLIILISRAGGVISARVYDKNYITNARSLDDISVILSRKRIWDKLPVMFLVDADKKIIVDANPAASEFYGYRIEEFKNMSISNISMLPADILAQELELALSGKKTFFISRHRVAGGQVKDVNYTTSFIKVGNKKYVLGFITDITRRKNLEKVIEEKNAVLTELNMNLSRMVQEAQKEGKRKEEMFLRQSKLAAIGEIVSSIADHWKEPLNTIGLLVQDMEDADKFGELDGEYIENIVKSVMSHLQNISCSIDTCVKFFKNDNEAELFDLRNAILGVVKVLDHRFACSKVTICVDCSCGKECSGFDENGACLAGLIDVLGRINEFKHALCNIMINSLDAILAARKSGTLLEEDEGLIFINIKTDGENVALSLRDNGGGMDEAALPKAFEPYVTTKDGGMGIGLYITKQLIEKNMKGSVAIENAREGCVVTITIPISSDKLVNGNG